MKKRSFIFLIACIAIASCKKPNPVPTPAPAPPPIPVVPAKPEGKMFSFIGVLDSHTAGAGGNSYIDFLRPIMKQWYGDGGSGLQMFDKDIALAEDVTFNKSAALKYMNLASFDSAPTKYSINGMGLYAVNGDNLMFDWQSKGEVKYEKARLFYLKQPGGGTFKVGFMDQGDNQLATVHTDSTAVSLGFIDLEFDSGSKISYNIRCSSINGNVGLFGVIFSNSSGAMYSRVAQEGMSLANIMKLSSDFRKVWYKTLNPAGVYFDGGTSDRKTVDAQKLWAWLVSYSNDVLGSSSAKLIMVHGIQPKDHASNHYDDYLAVKNSIQNSTLLDLTVSMGEYEGLAAKGFMLDGIYLNEAGNREKGTTFFNNMSHYFQR